MSVETERYGVVTMPQHLLNTLDIDTHAEQYRRSTMTKIIDVHMRIFAFISIFLKSLKR